MTSKVSAIILAAGKSLRMGQPKMLLPWGETTVLGQVVATFHRAGLFDIIIVTGGAREAVEAEIARWVDLFPVRTIHNPSFATGGMMTSVHAGLSAISPDSEAALIGLGDQPQIEEPTIRSILSLFEKIGAGIIVPSHERRRGHPILVDKQAIQSIMAFPQQSTLRDYLNANSEKIRYIEAGISILQDLDTPDDYRKFRNP